MDIRTIGVVGAGTIGRGVAHTFAEHGFDVVLTDVSKTQLDDARRAIAELQRLRRLYTEREAAADPAAVLDRITFDTAPEALAHADFVLENVTEDWDVKHEVYLHLDRICGPDVLFAVNTSAISITRVAGATGRPDRVLGMHFMNPVPLMPMVEVIKGFHTSEETMATGLGLLERIGKEGVVVADLPGFITNRVAMLTVNEAVFCVQDQVASAKDVDRIFKGCFGHRMGPLETGDLIGLDTILNSLTVLFESYRDPKYRPAPLLQKMVHAGLLGVKSGRGFYEYATPAR
jgi:3-hydroxybutyryl-CoA dehydrogenase